MEVGLGLFKNIQLHLLKYFKNAKQQYYHITSHY